MFDINQIALLAGVTTEEARTFLPIVLDSIRDYTHRSFITDVGISGDFTISADNKITSPVDLPSELCVDSVIELKYSLNNTKLYTIKSINGREIETHETLFEEKFNGFLIKLSFNNVNYGVVSSMINYKNTTIKFSAVKSESLGGYGYTLNVDSNSSESGYPINILSSLDSLKQLPDKREVEYYERGFIKYPLYRYSYKTNF